MATPQRIRRAGAAAVLLAALGACNSDSPSGTTADDGSFASLAAQIPPAVPGEANNVIYTFGDLDAATAAAGTTRPQTADPDEMVDWLLPLTGLGSNGEPAVASLQLASSLYPNAISRSDEIVAEMGWTVRDVHQFVEVSQPPVTFMVATVDDVADAIDAAIGPAPDGIWRLGGGDGTVDARNTTAARRVGESVRLAVRDGLLVSSRTTPPVTEWLDGEAGPDSAVVEIATALDDADAYAAVVVTDADFSVYASLGSRATPEQVEAVAAAVGALPDPHSEVGIGLTVTSDGDNVATIVYRYGTESQAKNNVAAIESLFGKDSFVNGEPISERLTLDSIVASGNLVVATASFPDGAFPSTVFSMIFQRDTPLLTS